MFQRLLQHSLIGFSILPLERMSGQQSVDGLAWVPIGLKRKRFEVANTEFLNRLAGCSQAFGSRTLESAVQFVIFKSGRNANAGYRALVPGPVGLVSRPRFVEGPIGPIQDDVNGHVGRLCGLQTPHVRR